jgi:hypothetical protein
MPKGAPLPATFYHLLVIGDVDNQFVRVKLPHLNEKGGSKDGFGKNFWLFTNDAMTYFQYRPVHKKKLQPLVMPKKFS